MWKWILDFWKPCEPKTLEHPHNLIRKKVDINSIRARIKGLGWNLLEVPVKKSNPDPDKRTIMKWKLVAVKGQSSYEVTGTTLEEAMDSIGKTLGVISKK